MTFDLKGHKCFWVYQNKTFFEEARGGFLWSPKYARDGKTNPGYEAMKEVRKGDIIFHSFMGKIAAIGKAKDHCYSAHRPNGAFSDWDPDGWRIDVEYFRMPIDFDTAEYRKDILRLQPHNGPMRSDGQGKQQYLCNANQAIFDYLMPKILHSLTNRNQKLLLDFIDSEIKDGDPKPDGGKPGKDPTPPPKPEPIILPAIEDGCKVDAILLGTNKPVNLPINTTERPNQKSWLGKKVGDILNTNVASIAYRVEKIYR